MEFSSEDFSCDPLTDVPTQCGSPDHVCDVLVDIIPLPQESGCQFNRIYIQ
jgi:hypothetical protein